MQRSGADVVVDESVLDELLRLDFRVHGDDVVEIQRGLREQQYGEPVHRAGFDYFSGCIEKR